MTTANTTRTPSERAADSTAIRCDELEILLSHADRTRPAGRALIAALICDGRIDVRFRAGLLMSLGAQRAHP